MYGNLWSTFAGVDAELDINEGDEVTIASSCHKLFAEEVTIFLLSHDTLRGSETFLQFLKKQLVVNKLLICKGMHLNINYLSQDVSLKVAAIRYFAVETSQHLNTPFQCVWQTEIYIESISEPVKKALKREIALENIGGYQLELQNLCQQINILFSLPLINGKPVKGILITGPSGCGKTLICEALKTKYGNKCVPIHAEDVKSKFRGESEQNLKQHFVKAASRLVQSFVYSTVQVIPTFT